MLVEVLLYVHRNRRLIRDGHLDFYTAPELWGIYALGKARIRSPPLSEAAGHKMAALTIAFSRLLNVEFSRTGRDIE